MGGVFLHAHFFVLLQYRSLEVDLIVLVFFIPLANMHAPQRIPLHLAVILLCTSNTSSSDIFRLFVCLLLQCAQEESDLTALRREKRAIMEEERRLKVR